MVSMARNWKAEESCMAALLEWLHCTGVVERTRFPIRSGAGKGLGAWGLLLLEGFGEALQSQVVVPHLGESLVLLVQAGEVNVVVADNGAAPLLYTHIVVSVIEGPP